MTLPPLDMDEQERKWTSKALRALRRALKKRDAKRRALNGLSSLMAEAHMQGRIHGKAPFGGGDEYRKLWLDSLVAYVRGLES